MMTGSVLHLTLWLHFHTKVFIPDSMALVSSLEDVFIDFVAIKEFDDKYSSVDFSQIWIVMAAYREAESIYQVIQSLPSSINDINVTPLVVVDGEDDKTYEMAIEAKAYVARAFTQRGQGAALRIAYQIALLRGARVIITVDGDGQCDPADIASVAEPVLRDDADLVLGSRTRGSSENTDIVRNLGVKVFSRLISFLTGSYITDTANPLRAMSGELAKYLVLEENQYQASEVILDALLGGFRVCERPAKMKARYGGTSKKGKNLIYGLRYFRVVARTYLREKK
ncbi:MAG: glycosyltransferase family 2 protein [Acidimicrobiales bacterium]|nr:glycosyltransferase family 2 protein [Acidimicrobiales bacterium]